MRHPLHTLTLSVALAAGFALSLTASSGAASPPVASPGATLIPAAGVPVPPPNQVKTCKNIGFPPNSKSSLPADFPAQPTGIVRCGLHADENIFLNRDGLNLDEVLEHYRTELRAQGYRAVIEGRRLRFSQGAKRGVIFSATPTDPPVGYRITLD